MSALRLTSSRGLRSLPKTTQTRLVSSLSRTPGPAIGTSPRRQPSTISPAPRYSSTATFTGPQGYNGDYLKDRAAAEAALGAEGWDLGSLAELPVTWGSQDSFLHVNNVHTFSYFEFGRIHFMKTLIPELDDPAKAEQSLLKGQPGYPGMILAKTSATYRRPVVYPDTLIVAHRAVPLTKPDRYSLEMAVYSLSQQAIVSTGDCTLVSYDYGTLKKTDTPLDLRKALEKRMNRT
ncbi:hypothetical protein T439DRAFT_323900 [Meredithblackwellia eburnea MCA 4105]